MSENLNQKIDRLSQGEHACLFFEDRVEQIDATARFLKAGLEKNERCIYLGDPLSVLAVRDALKARGVDTETQEKLQALILTSERDYLVGGKFDYQQTIRFLDLAIETSLKSGFTGLRATGEVAWEMAGDQGDLKTLLKYETMLDHFFYGKKLTGLCQYRRSGILSLKDAQMTHPSVISCP